MRLPQGVGVAEVDLPPVRHANVSERFRQIATSDVAHRCTGGGLPWGSIHEDSVRNPAVRPGHPRPIGRCPYWSSVLTALRLALAPLAIRVLLDGGSPSARSRKCHLAAAHKTWSVAWRDAARRHPRSPQELSTQLCNHVMSRRPEPSVGSGLTIDSAHAVLPLLQRLRSEQIPAATKSTSKYISRDFAKMVRCKSGTGGHGIPVGHVTHTTRDLVIKPKTSCRHLSP